jgi:hypothetical protein
MRGPLPGLIVVGSGAAVVIAYVIRFLAVPIGFIKAGFERIPRDYDDSARADGAGQATTMRLIHLPLNLAAATALLSISEECPKRVNRAILAFCRLLPVLPEQRTCRCTALSDAMCHVWTAPGWQEESSRRRLGRCSHVFGLLARLRPTLMATHHRTDPSFHRVCSQPRQQFGFALGSEAGAELALTLGG